jgi:hypothetical protein
MKKSRVVALCNLRIFQIYNATLLQKLEVRTRFFTLSILKSQKEGSNSDALAIKPACIFSIQ